MVSINSFEARPIQEVPTVNAQAMIKLWECIQDKHPDKPIVHLCDDAAYYQANILKAWLAQNLRTTLRFLPQYSPNLNLIERLWKYLRRQVISFHFYKRFQPFWQAILDFFKTSKNIKQRWRDS